MYNDDTPFGAQGLVGYDTMLFSDWFSAFQRKEVP